MLEFLIWSVLPIVVVALVILFLILRIRAKQAELKLKLETEANNAIRILDARLGQFQKELSELGKQLRLEKDAQFIKSLEVSAYTVLNGLLRQIESITHREDYDEARELVREIITKNEKPCPHILAEVYKRIAEYEKALREAPSAIQMSRQRLETYKEELNGCAKKGYQLGPDGHFAASMALIREAEKLISVDPPDPETAIASCWESTEIAGNFVGRINVWLVAHEEAKGRLGQVRELEHRLRERYKYACEQLKLLQTESPVNTWYPLDVAFGGNCVPKKLEELSGRRFAAMDKMDMETQDFEEAVALLKDILEELKGLEEVVERPIKTRAELCAKFAQKLHEV